MKVMEEFRMEFGVRATPKLLYTLISTAEGLSRWFADNVFIEDDVFHFVWEGSEQIARMMQSKENEYVHFQWLEEGYEGTSFEMHIYAGEMSSEVSLLIVDFAEPSEMDYHQRLWTTQVKQLQRLFNA